MGDGEGRPLYPPRLKGKRNLARALKEFKANVKRSWRVVRDESDGEIVLLHEVMGGKNRDSVGERKSKFGWKIVPAKAHVLPIIIQVPQT